MSRKIKTVTELKNAFFDAVENTGIQDVENQSFDAFVSAVEQYRAYCTYCDMSTVTPARRTLKAWHSEYINRCCAE